MIAEHLRTLELESNATPEQVKKAYRRFSKLYHPDINKSTDAHSQFLKIRESYEYLIKYGSNPQEPVYQTTYTYQTEAEDPYEVWRREYRARRAARERAEYAAKMNLIRRILRPFDYVAWLILGFNALLIVDLLIPDQAQHQQIIKSYRSFEKARYSNIYTSDIFVFTDYSMRLERGSIKPLESQKNVTVFASRIFNIPNKMKASVGDTEIVFSQVFSLFKCYKYLIPVMVVFLLFYFKLTDNPEIRLSQALFILIFGILQPVLLAFYY